MSQQEKTTNTKAFFFLRHNNDIDHITPVLYKWLSTQNIPTDVIIISDKKFLNDYRINYLKQYKNVNIYLLQDLFKKYSIPYIFNCIYFKYTTESDDIIKKNSLIKSIVDKIIRRIANKLFNGVDKAIVVFDWISIYFVQQIVQIAKNKKFTTVSLPHGDWPYLNYLVTKEDLDYSCMDYLKPLEIFNYIIVANQSTYKRYEKYHSEDKIKILGSSRYCDEWLDINSKLISSYNVDGDKDKLKIVFFLRNECYPIFWEEVVRTIKLILQFPNIYLVVKHHPRNRIAKKITKKFLNLYPDMKKNIDKNLKFIYGEVYSSSLTKWADLVIDLGTSTTWESIKWNKPVLMLEYLHSNYSTVAHYIKTSEIKCRDELYNSIKKLSENKNLKFYTSIERKKFINEIIDVPDNNILERYVQFLKMCLK